MMAFAIIYASTVFALAYALPKMWMIQAQENLVQMQVDALTNANGESVGNPSQFDFGDNGPYA